MMEMPMSDMSQIQTKKTAPKSHKWFFWLNIGLISTFFAEVISGSDMFPYFHLWGIMTVVPIYTLHSLVLATLVFRFGRPTLPALYFAGTLFGLYEAYITKVLWNPPWNGTDAFKLADVAVFDVLVLVFFWHVWMSFILPLLAAETWLTNSNQIRGCFPPRLQRFLNSPAGWLSIAVFGGFFVSINAKTVGEALLSGLGVLGVLGIAGWLWRRLTRGETYTLEELLPNRREFGFLVFLLAGIYLLTGLFLRPEAYPSIVGHLTIWALYALLAFLFWLALRRSKLCDFHGLEKQPPQWLWFVGVLTFTVFAMLAESPFLPVDGLIGLIGWYGSALLGLVAILYFAWLLIAKKVTLRV
jgi:hypothetical protein